MRKSGACSLLLSQGMNLVLTFKVRVRTVPVKPLFCAVKVPMLAMMLLFSDFQGRACRVLCGDPNGRSRAGRIACDRNTVKDQKRQRICCARKAFAPGKLFASSGCGHKARLLQGFTTGSRTHRLTRPKGALADPASLAQMALPVPLLTRSRPPSPRQATCPAASPSVQTDYGVNPVIRPDGILVTYPS